MRNIKTVAGVGIAAVITSSGLFAAPRAIAADSSAQTNKQTSTGCNRPLRILLTNDDGWKAGGIQAVNAALKAAGHTVRLVAPVGSQSGMGARIAYGGLLDVTHPDAADPTVTAVAGSPSDAVAFALFTFYAEKAPDLVISGTNFGQNTSRVTNHSGTVGAITTGIDRGVPGIAVSSEARGDYDAADATTPDFAGTAQFVVKTVRTIQRSAPSCSRLMPTNFGLNINYPFGGMKHVKSASLDSIDPFPTTYTLRSDGDYDISYKNASSSRAGVDYKLLADGNATITPIDGDLSIGKPSKDTNYVPRLVKQLD